MRQLQLAPREIRDQVTRWKDQFLDYKKGQLLVPGGISAQPALWLEAMHLLEHLEGRQQSEYLKRKKDAGDAE